jgi:chromosome segregation protein
MRLDKIKLAGFKSFVDPTTITFPSQRIGVVGPNGCGKSNVIDAVRWVMGESSAKQLRGDSLTDVIFNGSRERKPVGHATIELVFDNKDGTLGGQYAQYNEISVKRQLSRDGVSVYYLNGTRCRRRDITDIFLGTGLGPRSYAIIEQGTISRLIEAKPEELRVFLEEAAGISKYKERRRETETRIRHAKDNISRIMDLVGELEKRLNTLQRQAKTAEKYKELKQDERLLKAQLLVLRWQTLDAESAVMEADIRAVETGLEGFMAELRGIEVDIEKRRVEQVEVNEAFNVVQGRFYSVGADISRLEQSIQHVTEKRLKDQQDLEDIEQHWQEARIHINNDQNQIAGLKETLENSEPQLIQARQTEQQSGDALRQAEEAMQSWQHGWDEFNQQAADEMSQAEVERTRSEHLESELQRLQQRQTRLLDERQGMNGESLEQQLAALQQQSAESEGESQRLQQALHDLLTGVSRQRETNEQLNIQLRQDREQLQSLERRHASLAALQQAALGKQEGAVADWLQAQNLQGQQRLAETLTVANGWEQAVETVLGLNLEAVCVEGLEAVTAELHSLAQGTLTVFDTRSEAGVTAGHLATPLLQQVEASWALDSMLGGVYCSDTLDQALMLRDQLGAQESVVTRDGLWLGRDWLRVARPSDEKSGVLAREQELKHLSQQLQVMSAQVDDLDRQLQEGSAAIQALEEERNTLQQSLNRTGHKHAELRASLSSKEAHLDQLRQRQDQLSAELNEINAQNEKHSQELREARQRLEQMLERTAGHEQQRQALTQARDTLREALQAQRHSSQQDRDAAREIAMRIESCQAQLKAVQGNLDRMQQQQTQLSQRRSELQLALADGEAPVQAMQVELEQVLQTRVGIESELSVARQQVADCDHALRELSDGRHFVEQKVQDKRSDLDQLRMAWQEVKVRRQTLQEQLGESGHQREELLNELPEQANVDEWQQQVEKMEQRIQRLGAINLAAIEEFTEESARKAYLDSQMADLNEALDTLEHAIRKIDQETKARFRETFDTVNERLQELFPRVFGGGMASLEMTSDDLLESGVTVMARPPGKRNSSIHLLSGGEKALTAVALVFALFELNPAPFCMLDEVDAPLDDTNAARFSQLVREMSERVQFIFITHNKITMELADQLIGVTMHEPGVSRTVAVDVEEAVQMAEAG